MPVNFKMYPILMGVSLLLMACTDAPPCSIGDIQGCICPGGTWSGQNCRSDGQGWEPCLCELPTADTSGQQTNDVPSNDVPMVIPETYAFESHFGDGSSVSYPGQTSRHVLVHDLITFIDTDLTALVENGTLDPANGDVVDSLNFYYVFDSDADGSVEHGVKTTPPPLQTTHEAVAPNKNLKAKIAGRDLPGPHRDFDSELIGWPGISGASGLLEHLFERIEELAGPYAAGERILDGTGEPIELVFISAKGIDYAALLAAYLDGALSISQGLDDYLDNDLDGRGLNSSSSAPNGGLYTSLEHQWDEGFGYFGAARDYGKRSALENIGTGQLVPIRAEDTNGDGSIDLRAEVSFGASVLGARRDRESMVSTHFGADAYAALLEGRALAHYTAGREPTDAEKTAMIALRDTAKLNWERIIAATIIASLNRTLRQLAREPAEQDFRALARNWSRMKGHLLALQFLPNAQMPRDTLITIHDTIGVSPDMTNAEELRGLRDTLGLVYDFDAENLGDDFGNGGWGQE